MEIRNNFIEEILSVAWPRLRTKLINPKDPYCIDVLVEVANELYGVEVAYELHKNLLNGAYVTENNPLNYKKLKEDFWVKNKQSGNVYTVKSQNPEIHTEPSKDEIEAAKKEKSANADNTQTSEPTSYIGAAAGFGNRVLTKIKNWTRQEKEYFQKGYHKPGSEQRRNFSTAFKDKLKGAWNAVKDGLKHEYHTFKTAAGGVSKFFKGEKLTDEETSSLKKVGIKIATTALFAAVGGGLAHGATAFAKHVAIEFVPHVVGETLLMGGTRAALFADEGGDAETDLNFQKFGEMIADGLENMEISPEQMEAMVDSYEEKKKSGEIKIEPDTDQNQPTEETPKEKPNEEDSLEKDLDAIKFGMMTGAEKEAYLKKKRRSESIYEAGDIDVQSVLDSRILNPDTNRQIKVSTGLGYDKASGGYQAAKAKMVDSGISDDEIEKVEKEKSDSGDSNSDSDVPNLKVQSQMKEEQASLERDRDMGIAGAGGAVASQGESRYCNTMNTYDEEKFKSENREAIDAKKEKFKKSKLTADNARDLRALGLDPASDEAAEYIATREVFADKELERIKGIKGSVFYLKGKAGFEENEEAYKEWARTAYDGTLATRKILKENTSLDTSKPHTTVQSTTERDNKIQSILENKLKNAKLSGDKNAIKHYEDEIKSFSKYREYHDTYVIGEDKNGNMTIVSISNKKDSSLRDPQNNTTPASRFKIIKEQYGNDVANTVVRSLDRSISEVSDVKKATVNRTNDIEISDSFAMICDTPEMKKYMDKLKSNNGYLKYLQGKGLDVNKLSTKELLVEMQNHSRDLIANGKTPAYEPYGKITIKIGEFAQKANFKKKYPKINFDDKSVLDSIDTKESEKDIVNASHKKLVDTINNADADAGYPKDGINGPHTQGYISTVMDAMHFDSYIDGGDGKMILQMGIRGAQPEHIRSCLAEQTGFKGDTSTSKGKADLKKYLRENCKIDASSGSIFITDENGTRSIVEDTWRTAGTSQKVASGFGKDMRSCISKKVDSKRQK